jgi:hypothetical protein
MTAALTTMAGVAALNNDMSHIVYCSTKPLESGKRLELEKKYGQWAVESAIAVCPLGDIECIEREAKRLSETRLRRR